MSDLTISFTAYTSDGLLVSVTETTPGDLNQLRERLATLERLYPGLGSTATLLREAPDKSLRPFEYHVIGWLRGETQNKDGAMLPALYLYSDDAKLQFSVGTVYNEMLPKLPPSVKWQEARSVGNMAPDKTRAMRRPEWNDCDLIAVFAQQTDREGKPVLNEKGFPKLKFSHIVGYNGPDTEPTPPPAVKSQPGTQAPATPPPVPNKPDGAAPAPINGGLRPWAGPGSCPKCFAPAGKMHASTCTQGLAVPEGDAEEGDAFTDDPLLPWAKGYNDPSITLTRDASDMIILMRKLDRESRGPMTVSVPASEAPDGKEVRGLYNFLAGLVDNLAKTQGAGAGYHGKVLSFIFGAPIRAKSAPGANAKALVDGLYPGSQAKGPNPKYDHKMVASVKEIIAACMFIDSLQAELEYDDAA